MIGITTHVLDTARGRPAAGVGVTLERLTGGERWEVASAGRTDGDGRLTALTGTVTPGVYRLLFETAEYFQADGRRAFYPHVSIAFDVAEGDAHSHVPLLLSPFGYTTYRGS
jgi:5-hydroxyisourate hydrolase